MKKIYLLFLLFLTSLVLYSQDTLNIMQYNLLNYGNTTTYCTTTNNNLLDKEGYMRTIFSYVQPDILAVNEIGGNTYVIQRLIDSCLDVLGMGFYDHADYVNTNGSDIVSMLYYRTDKFTCRSATAIPTNTRDIILYELYYNGDGLVNGDTAFLYPVVCHLKAGSSSSDENERANMTQALMSELNTIGQAQNYFLAGDLNVKRSSEQAYQNLIAHSNSLIRFHDPINQPGNWNNTSSYAAIHTQSTHTSSNGCASTGGMDDRFDFILVNNNILNGTDHYTYVPASYKVTGNDGQHFNQAINSGSNSSLPADVLNALYHMSDHLPVVMKLIVDQNNVGIAENRPAKTWSCHFNNPVYNELIIYFDHLPAGDLHLSFVDLSGYEHSRIRIPEYLIGEKISVPVRNLERGLYLLKIQCGSNILTNKIVKQ